jgi:hypothetical protein
MSRPSNKPNLMTLLFIDGCLHPRGYPLICLQYPATGWLSIPVSCILAWACFCCSNSTLPQVRRIHRVEAFGESEFRILVAVLIMHTIIADVFRSPFVCARLFLQDPAVLAGRHLPCSNTLLRKRAGAQRHGPLKEAVLRETQWGDGRLRCKRI